MLSMMTQANTAVAVIWPLLPRAPIFLGPLTPGVTVRQGVGPVGLGRRAGWSDPGVMEGMMQKLRPLLHLLHFEFRERPV